MTATTVKGTAQTAIARARNLAVSLKQSVELGRVMRYRHTHYAKEVLEEIIALRRAVPFRRFNRDMGHKAGMAAGRYPQKAAREFLKLVKSVEANAQMKGLDTSSLVITQLVAHKASIPFSAGRQRHRTKRTHLDIEVAERVRKKKPERLLPGRKGGSHD